MKKFLLVLIVLCSYNLNAQCWVSVATGLDHTVAIKDDGTLWAWGNNSDGQLGNGSNTNSSIPVQIGTGNNWEVVTAGNKFTLAIKTDNTLWSWGDNSSGQLGIGSTNDVNVPTQVPGNNWVNVVAGITKHVIGLKTDDDVSLWGDNTFGQIGTGDPFPYYTSPIEIATLVGTVEIAAGNGNSFIIDNGELYAIGKNNVGQLGINSTANVNVPNQVGTDTNWKMVAAGNEHTIGIKTNGTLWVWGSDANGNMGNGAVTTSYDEPDQLGIATDWDTAYAGTGCYATKTSGSLWTWGSNMWGGSIGVLGAGPASQINTPVQLLTTVNTLSSRFGHSMAINNNDYLLVAGIGPDGQLGPDTTMSNIFFFSIDCPVSQAPPLINAVNDSFTMSSCSSVSTAVSILANDTVDGAVATTANTDMQLTGTVPPGITLNFNGTLTISASVAPNVYTITYKLCEAGSTTNCVNATITLTVLAVIDAVDDTYTVTAGSTTTPGTSLFANDDYDCAQATGTNTNMSLETSVTGITLNTTTGQITIDSTVTAGEYTFTYELCDTTVNSTNCDIATVTVIVQNYINAVNDSMYVEFEEMATLQVLDNDAYTGGVSISVVGIFPPQLNFNSSTGMVIVTETTPLGTYTFTYSICEDSDPTNCDTATVTITVGTSPFTPGVRANNRVKFSGLQTTGKIIIGGIFTTYNYQPAKNIARLTTSLGLDSGFTSTGPHPSGYLFDVDVQPNDYIVVAGTFDGFNNANTSNGLIRLQPNGALDSAFNPSGVGVNGTPSGQAAHVMSVAIRPNGSMVAVGNFLTYNGVGSNFIIGLTSNGAPDPAFIYGTGFNYVAKIAVTQQSNTLVAGSFTRYNNIPVERLIRLLPNGNIDPIFVQKPISLYSFDYPNVGATGEIETIVIQPDGYILIGGAFTAYDGVPRKNIARLLPNGGLDFTFDPGDGFDGTVRTISVQPNGDIFVGGSFTTYDGVSVNKMVRLNSTGQIQGFTPSSTTLNSIYTLTRQPDSKIIIGGRFTNYNGVYAGNITRIIPSTGVQGRLNMFDNTDANVSIYPNPSEGLFTIDFKGYDEQRFNVTVHNVLGQLIYSGEVTAQNPAQLDLSSANAGNYFVTLQNSTETINKIITKK